MISCSFWGLEKHLISIWAWGTVLGTVARRGNHKPSIRYLLIAAFVFCVLEIAFSFSQVYIFSLPLIASVGFVQLVLSATANTTLQMVTPNHLRGRVMSVYLMVFAGGMPLGNLFARGLAVLFGAPISLLIGGMLSLIAAIAGVLAHLACLVEEGQTPIPGGRP